ncbi:MAG: hypothetical protein JO122_01575 [Acetobacteraceae bacterium]|nr:hypothetical protein [Acetobacteraceae bacterium]
MRRRLLLLVPVILTGCGGRQQPAPPQDSVLRREAEAGRAAFSLERPAEAAAQYKLALLRAEARDDAKAIGDYGYDLAVAQLAANQPREALASARQTETELARRGVAVFPALVLVEAVALYRSGASREADRLAAQVEAGGDPAAAARAAFLRGLIADEAGSEAGLAAALARLAHPVSAEERADAFELAARRDIRAGVFARAASEAAQAVALRRTAMDYRGMARGLAVQAEAIARMGDNVQAADLYMRAGESAAAQGDAGSARRWVHQAVALDDSPALRRTGRRTLAELASRQGPRGE